MQWICGNLHQYMKRPLNQGLYLGFLRKIFHNSINCLLVFLDILQNRVCNKCFLSRVDVCSLLLSHGADPSLLNCHSKSAVDVCPSDDLQEKLQCMITIKK